MIFSRLTFFPKYFGRTSMSFHSQDLSAMRQPYKDDKDVILEENLPSRDPIELFKIWFEEAKSCGKILEPNAVCVSTSTKSGLPSSRMVLLKYFGTDGFKFYTNLISRKGQELKENPKAALLFYWDPLNRQVRIEGDVEPLADSESKAYFESRPKRSQLAAAISEQSKPIASRAELISRYNELEKIHADDRALKKPDCWGGFRVIPKLFEFWQGQSSRLHDRIVFCSKNEPITANVPISFQQNDWIVYRLQP